MKNFIYTFMLTACLSSCTTQQTSRTIGPTEGQQAMIDRKYGMFLHFGMNTYLNTTRWRN